MFGEGLEQRANSEAYDRLAQTEPVPKFTQQGVANKLRRPVHLQRCGCCRREPRRRARCCCESDTPRSLGACPMHARMRVYKKDDGILTASPCATGDAVSPT
eukprot:5661539-Pleurochrysis_carterae.AAC.3